MNIILIFRVLIIILHQTLVSIALYYLYYYYLLPNFDILLTTLSIRELVLNIVYILVFEISNRLLKNI